MLVLLLRSFDSNHNYAMNFWINIFVVSSNHFHKVPSPGVLVKNYHSKMYSVNLIHLETIGVYKVDSLFQLT